AARGHGPHQQVPSADHPRLGLCVQLHPPDPRTAARLHQPHFPSGCVMSTQTLTKSEAGWDGSSSRHDLSGARSPDAPDTEGYADQIGAVGYVHSLETGSTVDGPGVRATLFLSGCFLRCQYCHNPDTWHLRDGTRIAIGQATARLADFAPALRAVGGGLTLSGGEPLVQRGFSRRMFAAAKEFGLHTALDTSGFLGARADEEYLRHVDLVLLDIKSGDPDLYHRLTGAVLAPTLRFAERLAAIGKPVWIRYVLVPGLTDNPE